MNDERQFNAIWEALHGGATEEELQGLVNEIRTMPPDRQTQADEIVSLDSALRKCLSLKITDDEDLCTEFCEAWEKAHAPKEKVEPSSTRSNIISWPTWSRRAVAMPRWYAAGLALAACLLALLMLPSVLTESVRWDNPDITTLRDLRGADAQAQGIYSEQALRECYSTLKATVEDHYEQAGMEGETPLLKACIQELRNGVIRIRVSAADTKLEFDRYFQDIEEFNKHVDEFSLEIVKGMGGPGHAAKM